MGSDPSGHLSWWGVVTQVEVLQVGVVQWGVVLVGNCPGGEWSSWAVVLVGNHPGGSSAGRNCPGGNCPVGSCPRTCSGINQPDYILMVESGQQFDLSGDLLIELSALGVQEDLLNGIQVTIQLVPNLQNRKAVGSDWVFSHGRFIITKGHGIFWLVWYWYILLILFRIYHCGWFHLMIWEIWLKQQKTKSKLCKLVST